MCVEIPDYDKSGEIVHEDLMQTSHPIADGVIGQEEFQY